LSPQPLPTLETPRLILRPYAPHEFESFAALAADEETMRHMDGPIPRDRARELFDQFLAADADSPLQAWAIADRESGAFAGHIALTTPGPPDERELLIIIAEPLRGKGLGPEAGKRLVAEALKRAPCRRVIATIDVDHPASLRMLEKIGMTLIGRDVDADGEFFIYGIDAPSA
jgi:RimJ/RimL family protein N-acetyltransferase